MKLGCGGSFFMFFVFLIISTAFISECDARDVENGENPVHFVNIMAYDVSENKYLCFSYNEREKYLKDENITFILPENSGEINYPDYEKCKFETKEKTDEYILYEIDYTNKNFDTTSEYKVYSKNNFKLTYSKMFHIHYMFMSFPIALVLLVVFSVLLKIVYQILKDKAQNQNKDEIQLKKREEIKKLLKKIRFTVIISFLTMIPLCTAISKQTENYYERNIESGDDFDWKTFYVAFNTKDKKYICLEKSELNTCLNNVDCIFNISEEICGKKFEGNMCSYTLKEKNANYNLYNVIKSGIDSVITTEYKVYNNKNIILTYTKNYNHLTNFNSMLISIFIIIFVNIVIQLGLYYKRKKKQ